MNPIYLRDLIDCSPIEPAKLSEEERREFIRGVEREMDRLGFTEANERTVHSERLTGEDYRVRVNY